MELGGLPERLTPAARAEPAPLPRSAGDDTAAGGGADVTCGVLLNAIGSRGALLDAIDMASRVLYTLEPAGGGGRRFCLKP